MQNCGSTKGVKTLFVSPRLFGESEDSFIVEDYCAHILCSPWAVMVCNVILNVKHIHTLTSCESFGHLCLEQT